LIPLGTEARITTLIREKKEKVKKDHSEKAEAFRSSMARSLSSPDGQILLSYLMRECGYQKNSVQGCSQSGELLNNNTIYNEARRDLYLRLRGFVPKESLIKVEIYGISNEEAEMKEFI